MHPLFHPLFIEFCTYFNGNQDYFECHEALEEYWKEIAPGEREHPLVGYVQLATGLYHWRRDNRKGATRILQKAVRLFEKHAASPFFDYVQYDELLAQTKLAATQAEHAPFQPFLLPICNEQLHMRTAEAIAKLPVLDAQFILHKHKLRDRSHIIAEREANRRAR